MMTDEKKRELRRAAQLDLLENSNIPEIYWDEIQLAVPDEDIDAYARLNEIKKNILTLSEPSIDDFHNLMICSSHTGNGKTSWALKILQYFLFRSASTLYYTDHDNAWGYFVSVPQFVLMSKEYDSERRKRYFEMLDMIERARVVVFDDIATGEYSRAEYMALYSAIDSRVFKKQCCIFTSNFEDENNPVLLDRLGVRLVDRIYCTSEKIILNGEGVRH